MISFPKTVSVAEARQNIAALIDHTLLKPEADRDSIRRLCREARQYHFASVCVNPDYVSLCRDLLRDSGIPIATVIGFPLGATTAETKIAEAIQADLNGANELDMVINIGRLKSGDDDFVRREIRRIVQSSPNQLVKVIIETALLSDAEKIRACQLAQEAGAHFVKTSTGFSQSGATETDVKLMRKTVGSSMGVKAAGGIRSLADAMHMIAAGANRIGASAGVQIIRKAQHKTGD